ncbi:hypothetical protein [Chitinophaga cymbidii]|nr:hypothetical protein [Chitinophaga cymbidii]
MSYLLIGNISALICEDCIEPLANARIRIYLPDGQYDAEQLARGIFKDLRQVSERDVLAKSERLLAESTLDDRGNFSVDWEDIHLFTEPLEMDICLNDLKGRQNGQQGWVQYHLSTFVPHWKRNKDKHVAAFAYVVPSDKWNVIRGAFSTWVITGAVKDANSHQGIGAVRVEAYNAWNNRLLGWADTSDNGRYKIYFSEKEVSGGRLLHLIREEGIRHLGPDVYFKVYAGSRLIWCESKETALRPERQQLAPCSKLNILIRPDAVKKQPRLTGWLHDLIHTTKTQANYKDHYVM